MLLFISRHLCNFLQVNQPVNRHSSVTHPIHSLHWLLRQSTRARRGKITLLSVYFFNLFSVTEFKHLLYKDTKPVVRSFVRSFTSLSPVHPFVYSPVLSFILSFVRSLSLSLVYSFVRSLVPLLVLFFCSFILSSFLRSSVCGILLFLRSFVRSLVLCFIRSFFRSLVIGWFSLLAVYV